ncbi:MAG: class I SAM-dependent methyltransferase [Saprospiraceae bacterium]|nr:class I SAM-dependent methyltransferase [Saprospiraceae bacterium]
MKPIRLLYEEHGAEGYYQNLGDSYENPHFPEIEILLRNNLHRIDTTRILDFAAGGGEVTRVLMDDGIQNVTGADPFTGALYKKNTGLDCEPWSFSDVVREGLPFTFSTVISSFALHLCPASSLFPLCWNLLDAAPLLVVITPHKRPELEIFGGFRLVWEDAALTQRGKKVRLKAYEKDI